MIAEDQALGFEFLPPTEKKDNISLIFSPIFINYVTI